MTTDVIDSPVQRNVRWVLLGVMLAMLLSMLDNMIVSTAMPTIVRDLGGLAHMSWVVTAYVLATAVSTPVWGKLGDLYGRKQAYLTSVAVFLVGSALSGTAHSMTELIIFRICQGLGAGGIGASAFALIGTLVPPRERGKYAGMTATVMAVGSIGGPLLGGFVTSHLGWRWAFYLNLPLGVIAIVWCYVMLHLPATRTKARIDWAGIVLLTVTISAVVLAATWAGSTYPWGSWQVLTLAAVALASLAAFIASQRRAAEPVLPLRIFTANYRLAAVMTVAAGANLFGASLYLPLFQQTVQGASAANSGLLLLPMLIPVVVVSQVAGKVMSATGRYKIFPVLGTAFSVAGMFLLSTMDVDTSRFVTCCYMVLVGLGVGLQFQMTTAIAQNSVELRDMGAASAGITLVRSLGGSIGVAVFGSLFTQAIQSHAGLGAIASGTHDIFLVAAAVSVFAFVAAVFIKEVPLRSSAPRP
jgi:EmrB/QacA subfamily drug resistance transporter